MKQLIHVTLGSLALFLLGISEHSDARPTFKEKPTRLTAYANEPFDQDLKLLLNNVGSTELLWAALGQLPSWLKLDAPGDRLWGTPSLSDVKTFNFNLSVKEVGADQGDIGPVELTVKTKPQWNTNNINLGTQHEDAPFTFDLKPFVSDPSGSPLTFSSSNLKPWMSLSNNGVLTGTPKRTDVGDYSGLVFTATNNQGVNSSTNGFGTVLKTIHPPKWVGDPLELANAAEDSPYTAETAPFVLNFEGTPLTFSLGDPIHPWLNINTSGQLSGTPTKPHIGITFVRVKVTTVIDGQTFDATTTFRVNVIHVNHTPKWTQDPIQLPDNFTWVPYSQSLKPFVTDIDDGDTLTFEIVSGPAWALLSSEGQFGGTSDKPNLGLNEWVIRVSDGQSSTTATVRVLVIKSNEPPFWVADPTVLPNAKEDFVFTGSLLPHIQDPDNDPVQFKVLSGPSWLTVDASGNYSGTPGAAHLGSNVFKIRVSDKAGFDDADVTVVVEHTNHAPKWTEPITFSVNEESPVSLSVATFASDPDPTDTLTFSKISGPAWANIDAAGTVTGTPQIPDEGENRFIVRVDDGQGLFADATLILHVLHINHPPFWTQDPIVLPNAKERTPYSESVKAFAQDIDPNDLLSFAKVSGPAWLAVGIDGTVSGTPQRPDVGSNLFKIKVTDLAGASATVSVTLEVEYVNNPPTWKPLTLPKAKEDLPYSFNLKPFAEDVDNDPLTFKMTSGPSWLFASESGILSGVPKKEHLGAFSVTFEVSDGKVSSSITVASEVLHTNHAPYWTQNPFSLPSTKEKVPYTATVVGFAKDDDEGDTLEFAKLSGPTWAQISKDGTVSGTPQRENVGLNTFTVKVTDNGGLSASATFTIFVEYVNTPPRWTQKPLTLSKASEDKPYTFTLTPFAVDDDGDKLTFKLVSGPAWLVVSPAGVMGGQPGKNDIGPFTAILEVDDGHGGVQNEANGSVLHTNHAPYWTQDPVLLPNAPEKAPYSQILTPWAKDDDAGDRLTFTKISGPQWATIQSDGTLSGTPQRKDIGVNTFRIRVSDAGGLSAIATVQVTVEKVNTPPRWTTDPLTLDTAYEDKTYSYSVKPFAIDEDGDTLTFRIVSGPAWLFISTDGTLTGVPTKADLGPFTSTLEVSDGKATAQVTANGKVNHTNHPPVVHQPALAFEVKERATFVENLNQPKYVEDLDVDPLSFLLLTNSSCVTLSATGELVLKPLHRHLGDHRFDFEARDGVLTTRGYIEVKVIRDPQAPEWLENPIRVTVHALTPFSFSVTHKAKDLDGVPLTFKKSSGPEFLQVSASGAVTGNAAESQAGEHTFTLTATNDALSSDAALIVTVLPPNHPPYWTQDPIRLPNATETIEYGSTLMPFAKEDDPNDPIRFVKISGPSWLNVNPDGSVNGVPNRKDIGENTFVVAVMDSVGASSKATVHIFVEKLNTPPRWTSYPIPLVNGIVDTSYAFDLATYATDADGDPLSFRLIQGPEWMFVGTDGKITGVPQAHHVGDFSAVFEVSDGKATAQTEGFAKVIFQNRPPVILSFQLQVKERNVREENLNQNSYVYDPDGDNLSFELLGTSDWITLTGAGALTLKPLHKHLGSHTVRIRVSDGKLTTEGTFAVLVVPDPLAPIWLENPIRLTAHVDELLSTSIASKAKDPDGLILTFSKLSGPDWLKIQNHGVLEGTPLLAHLGENTFMVRVSNEYLSADATLIITVIQGGDQTDEWQVDTAVPGAPSENLWVVDGSANNKSQVSALKTHVETYPTLMAGYGIHHAGLYLSTDADHFKRPVAGENGDLLLIWNHFNWTEDFRYRIRKATTQCCTNSPVWALFQYYKIAQDLTVYHNGFVEESVPVDVMIVTQGKDEYDRLKLGTPQSQWKIAEFIDHFKDFHEFEKQAYRISVASKWCPIPPSPPGVRAEAIYSNLTQATGGQCYYYSTESDMPKILKDYAARVSFRATVHAKNRLKLSKMPKPPSSLEVRLAGLILTGNTGTASDRWVYDASSNEVVLFWYKIADGPLKPGDKIEIKYRF